MLSAPYLYLFLLMYLLRGLTPKAEEKNIEIIVNLIEVEILGDKARLKQIFLNVIDNAIKYSYQEGQVTIALTQEEKQVVISVTDHESELQKNIYHL